MTIYVNARAIIERKNGSETEILLQRRARAGEPERWELPGGQINQFESVRSALEREIAEETGLRLTQVHEDDSHVLHQGEQATVETFEPLFAYQTLDGPVDSLGFYFRCSVQGEVIDVGDDAKQPTWFEVRDLKQRFHQEPDQFDWLTQAALERYLHWRANQHPTE
jgi:8-oxo-dGTP diphosphatase